MKTNELRIFQGEVQKQCEFALISVQGINDSLKNLSNENASLHFWYYIQNFLISTANVSKFLWGSYDTPIESRKLLRESLEVKENSFHKIKSLRNHFEHFDERIETWASSSKRKNFVDSNIGPSNMIMGFEPSDFLRNFDTDLMAVTFKGNKYEIQPIVDELSELHRLAKQEADKPHWD